MSELRKALKKNRLDVIKKAKKISKLQKEELNPKFERLLKHAEIHWKR